MSATDPARAPETTSSVSRSGPIATITLKQSAQRLPLSVEGVADLSAALDDVLDGPERPRVVILTGTGRAFATGADLAAIGAQSPAENSAYNRRLIDTFARIAEADMPVIAAINGLAFGGGLELALTADFRIAADQAVMGLPEVSLGLVPGAGGTTRLPRLIGEPAALDLLLSGRTVDAREALQMHLVSRVVPRTELTAAAHELAGKLAATAPLAQAVIKRQVHAGRDSPVPAAIDAVHDAMAPLLTSDDLIEGIDAFLSKRRPVYTGH